MSDKLNVANVFNREEEVSPAHKNKNLDYNESAHRAQKYEQVLGASIVELEKLKGMAWNGVPQGTPHQRQNCEGRRGSYY